MSTRNGFWVASVVLVMTLVMAVPAQAVVTHDGTAGVAANVFTDCTGCHSSALTGVDRNGATVGVDFNSYALALGDAAHTATAGDTDAQRAAIRVAAGTMPPGGPSAAQQTLMAAWDSDGYLQNAAPVVSTSAESGVGPYSATFNGTVFENGLNTTVSFKYSTLQATANAGNGTSVAATSPTGTGGGTSSSSFSVGTGNVLACNTTYYYSAHGTNGAGSHFDSTSDSFTTGACTSISTSAVTAATEGVAYSYDVNASGGDGTYTFSLNAAAITAGLSINSSSGVISWTPPQALANYTQAVTVTADDNSGEPNASANQAFTINVAADNDAPGITSSAVTSAVESSLYQYDVNATDPESQTLTWSLFVSPTGMTINSSSGLIQWTPDNTQSGASHNVTARVTDGTTTVSQSWSIAVTAVNTPPNIISFAPSTTGTEDTLYSYAVSVSDTDDANNGTDLTWSLPTGAPTGMTISGTGTISWTPVEGQSGSFGPITVRVADGGENGALPDSETFSITVAAVNDAPVIGVIANQNVTELSAFTLTPSVVDPDDANDGVNLLWSLAPTPPTGMGISNIAGTVGRISYTPGQNTVPPAAAWMDVSITAQVDDGHENGVTTATRTFTLRINKLDADGDLVADYNDNCVNDANATQADNDGDGVAGDNSIADSDGGDACDSDDDNDGISDVAELANGLNPFSNTDANLDLDGDGISNIDEFLACAGVDFPNCLVISEDSVGPIITTNGDQTVTATGYYTAVDVSATATDVLFGAGTPVTVSVDNDGPFRPGVNRITWTAEDAAGNVAEVEQTITVVPTASLGGTLLVGEGQSGTLTVLLNGESPLYPVEISYVVGGTAGDADHDLGSSGTVVIASGTRGVITLNAVDDGTGENDETVAITLLDITAGSAELSAANTGSFVLVERNVAPIVRLWTEQDGERRTVVYVDGGSVMVEALATDPNGDALTYAWSGLAGAAADNIFTFDPSALMDGTLHDVVVRVSDGANITEQRVTLAMVEGIPVPGATDTDGDGINDNIEGGGDYDGDGLLDYLDAVNAPDMIALRNDSSDAGLLLVAQVDAGLQIAAGAVATASQNGGVQVLSTAIVDDDNEMVVDADYIVVGALYDFVITGLTEADRVARVVLPLTVALPPNAVWRKYINGGWFTFALTVTDSIASARTVNGQCPPPEVDESWAEGLAAGDECVRLTLSDGGPNDADGAVNGSIRDPGGPAVPRVEELLAPSGDTTGHLGIFVLGLMFLLGIRRIRQKKAADKG